MRLLGVRMQTIMLLLLLLFETGGRLMCHDDRWK